jgi:hypothetical protein
VTTEQPLIEPPDPRALRTALLDLHRELLGAQVIEVERATGRAMTPNEVLKAAMEDPRFLWLRELSGLVAELDAEISSAKSEDRIAAVDAHLERTRALVSPPDPESAFGALYLRSLQRNPSVVMAHSSVTSLIGTGSEPEPA